MVKLVKHTLFHQILIHFQRMILNILHQLFQIPERKDHNIKDYSMLYNFHGNFELMRHKKLR